MRIAKMRKGNLRNRLRNALWLVGRISIFRRLPCTTRACKTV